jgi:hypothetical protein
MIMPCNRATIYARNGRRKGGKGDVSVKERGKEGREESVEEGEVPSRQTLSGWREPPRRGRSVVCVPC